MRDLSTGGQHPVSGRAVLNGVLVIALLLVNMNALWLKLPTPNLSHPFIHLEWKVSQEKGYGLLVRGLPMTCRQLVAHGPWLVLHSLPMKLTTMEQAITEIVKSFA